MKKLLVLLLAFSMALSVCMVGCGKESYKGVDATSPILSINIRRR